MSIYKQSAGDYLQYHPPPESYVADLKWYISQTVQGRNGEGKKKHQIVMEVDSHNARSGPNAETGQRLCLGVLHILATILYMPSPN